MTGRIKLLGILLLAAATVGCSMRGNQSASAPPAGPVRTATTEPGVIPSGTTMVIRTNEAINAQQAGQTYSGQVAENIEDQSGAILVPRGSPAELAIARIDDGGTIGTQTLALALRSITVNGRRYTVTSASNEKRSAEGLGRNRRTAEMVGGGALLGTVLGAIAGGGRGAAIGAIGGAAGGAAVQVLTRGKEIQVPAETLLTFRIEEPLRLVG